MIKKRFLSMLVLLMAVAAGVVAQNTYTVTVEEGTDDSDKWTITPSEAATTGVTKGTPVTLKYNGSRKVKNIPAT